jgi:pyruvate formate-lyase activating enzyme-like uncharacterized protein
MKPPLRRSFSFRVSRMVDDIVRDYRIPRKLIEADKKRLRILIASWILEDIAGELKEKKLKPALVWEYPTWDALITELKYL